jgi:GNAT superfamily N-acetyltransferase
VTGAADDAGVTHRDVGVDDSAWPEVARVLRQLRPHLDDGALRAVAIAGAAQGLTFTAALEGDRCLGVAGWRVMDTTSVVRKLYVDDLVTDAAARSRGVGAGLLDHVEARAVTLRCTVVELDSGHHRRDAHRFYAREGFEDVSRHFARRVGGEPDR